MSWNDAELVYIRLQISQWQWNNTRRHGGAWALTGRSSPRMLGDAIRCRECTARTSSFRFGNLAHSWFH